MADDSAPMGQDDIEALLEAAKAGAPQPIAPEEPAEQPSASLDQSEIEALLRGGEAGATKAQGAEDPPGKQQATATTAPTPMITPSVASIERNRFWRNPRIAVMSSRK